MNNTALSSLTGHSQLRRLVALRSVAIAAQLLTLAAVWKILELELDWQPMLLTIAALASINLFSWLRLRSDKAVSNPELFAQLCTDVLGLSILLYFGGGSTNPFVSLFLLPLVIAAATLPGRYSGMASPPPLRYSVLMFYYIPLPHNHQHDSDSAFNAHVLGMWLGRYQREWWPISGCRWRRRRSHDMMLARVREEILRNERIVTLGIQSPARRMNWVRCPPWCGDSCNDVAALPEWRDGLAILEEQVRGCKRILDKILANARIKEPLVARRPPGCGSDDEVAAPHRTIYLPPGKGASGGVAAPLVSVDATLRAALMNLLNNAADAAPQPIEIRTHWDDAGFTLEIHDHGKGLSEEAELKAGSAFFTTKTEGHGLGLFLANATLERMNGSVRLFNREQGGATTKIVIPITKADL